MNDEQLGGLARRQYGLVSRSQLEVLGYSKHAIDWRVEQHQLECVHRGVYRLRGSVVTWEQKALAAVLCAGRNAVLSHRSAARLYGLDGVPLRERDFLELSTPARRNVRMPQVTAHRIDGAPATRFRGIPVTHLPRTLLDLSSVLSPSALEISLDSAARIFPALKTGLPEWLKRVGGHGHSGIAVLRALVVARIRTPTDSALETRVLQRLRELKLPAPRQLFPVHAQGRFVAELDFAWPDEKVALHVDGYRWHFGRHEFDNDAGKRSTLAALGWLSLVVTSKSLESLSWVDNLVRALTFRAKQRSMF